MAVEPGEHWDFAQEQSRWLVVDVVILGCGKSCRGFSLESCRAALLYSGGTLRQDRPETISGLIG